MFSTMSLKELLLRSKAKTDLACRVSRQSLLARDTHHKLIKADISMRKQKHLVFLSEIVKIGKSHE